MKFDDVLIEFDEMGFEPTTLVSDYHAEIDKFRNWLIRMKNCAEAFLFLKKYLFLYYDEGYNEYWLCVCENEICIKISKEVYDLFCGVLNYEV